MGARPSEPLSDSTCSVLIVFVPRLADCEQAHGCMQQTADLCLVPICCAKPACNCRMLPPSTWSSARSRHARSAFACVSQRVPFLNCRQYNHTVTLRARRENRRRWLRCHCRQLGRAEQRREPGGQRVRHRPAGGTRRARSSFGSVAITCAARATVARERR